MNRLDKRDGNPVVKTIIYIVCIILALLSIFPFVVMVINSTRSTFQVQQHAISLIPSSHLLDNFKVFQGKPFNPTRGFMNSMIIAVGATVCTVYFSTLTAYALVAYEWKLRNAFFTFVLCVMMIPAQVTAIGFYQFMYKIHMTNNFLALIIPNLLFSPFNMFLVRNYMDGLPDSLRESATLDGANDITICFRIYLPLSIPALATITLFYGLAYWNDWFNAIMLVDDSKLYPLQYLLLELRSQIQMIRDMQSIMGGMGSGTKAPSESLKMATSIVTIGPIVLLYPLLQRYFVKGLIVGAVKE